MWAHVYLPLMHTVAENIEMIEEIASQTQMLSLNATI
jgi:methyl-accepting chemotaxis protein